MSFQALTARRVLTIALTAASIGAGFDVARAGSFALPFFPRPTAIAGSPIMSFPGGVGAWTKLHTEAPSRFGAGAPRSLGAVFGGPKTPLAKGVSSGPAVGPAGAQYGNLPVSGKNFVSPTVNAAQAKQTQNSVQASNTQMSSNAVQGVNCNIRLILGGFCK
jgi:hypothetical protein